MSTDNLETSARKLLRSRTFGILATNSNKFPGTPFASVVNFAIDGERRPLFLLSLLALHTQNILQDPKASLLVFEPDMEAAPLTSARLNLFGEVKEVPESEIAAAKQIYLAAHPDSAQWADFGDFSIYRMQIAEAYYVGGFGVMGWVSGL